MADSKNLRTDCWCQSFRCFNFLNISNSSLPLNGPFYLYQLRIFCLPKTAVNLSASVLLNGFGYFFVQRVRPSKRQVADVGVSISNQVTASQVYIYSGLFDGFTENKSDSGEVFRVLCLMGQIVPSVAEARSFSH